MEQLIKNTVEVSFTAAIPVAIMVCWLVGWAIKQYNWFDKKHIPLTMMLVGVIVVYFMGDGSFTIENTLFPGMVSGALSVFGYDLIEQYVFKPRKEVKFNEIPNVKGE